MQDKQTLHYISMKYTIVPILIQTKLTETFYIASSIRYTQEREREREREVLLAFFLIEETVELIKMCYTNRRMIEVQIVMLSYHHYCYTYSRILYFSNIIVYTESQKVQIQMKYSFNKSSSI